VPFLPHTDEDRAAMLAAIGVGSLEDLFAPIPEAARLRAPLDLPEGLAETEVLDEMRAYAGRNRPASGRPCFLGGGMYRHAIPAVVDALGGRAEFVTAYTPYQAEASQGTLGAFFEFQTMIAELLGMEIANASMYDGASAFAEGVLMAAGIAGRKGVLVSRGVHPHARRSLATLARHVGLEVHDIPLEGGRTRLPDSIPPETACFAVQNPNVLGAVEDVCAFAKAAHDRGALCVVSVNPIAMGLLASPGECGADVAVGEGQPLGVPLQYGGPSFGFFASRAAHVRRMPGRIVGRTVDREGKPGYVLTFQTREQHIRREKATSNLCTNNALMALRGAIYLAALGPKGLEEVAAACASNAQAAAQRIFALPGYAPLLEGPFFHEFPVRCLRGADRVREALRRAGILGGLPLRRLDPDLPDALLFAFTEVNTTEEIDLLVETLAQLR
jgi:glycine dehydrogenase subunit 1